MCIKHVWTFPLQNSLHYSASNAAKHSMEWCLISGTATCRTDLSLHKLHIIMASVLCTSHVLCCVGKPNTNWHSQFIHKDSVIVVDYQIYLHHSETAVNVLETKTQNATHLLNDGIQCISSCQSTVLYVLPKVCQLWHTHACTHAHMHTWIHTHRHTYRERERHRYEPGTKRTVDGT